MQSSKRYILMPPGFKKLPLLTGIRWPCGPTDPVQIAELHALLIYFMHIKCSSYCPKTLVLFIFSNIAERKLSTDTCSQTWPFWHNCEVNKTKGQFGPTKQGIDVFSCV